MKCLFVRVCRPLRGPSSQVRQTHCSRRYACAEKAAGPQAELAWVTAQTGASARAARALHVLLLRARANDPAERMAAADLAAGARQVLEYLLVTPANAC